MGHRAPKTWVLLLVLAICSVIAGCAPGLVTQTPSVPTPIGTDDSFIGIVTEHEDEIIRQALFSPPTQCGHNCFWEIEPGRITYGEFKQILLEIFVTSAYIYEDEDIPLRAMHRGDYNFGANSKANTTFDDTVDYIYLRVSSPYAQDQDWYDISHLAPAAIIDTFGVPDDAFIIRFLNTGHYKIYFYYASSAFVYELDGAVNDDTICLTLSEIEEIGVYRFGDAEAALEYIGRWESPPPRLTDEVDQTLDDLALVAADPDANCLTLVPAAS